MWQITCLFFGLEKALRYLLPIAGMIMFFSTLARNLSPVTFKLSVPMMSDKPEWNLQGQMLSLTMPLTETVAAIKARIHEELGMPPGKQKLQHENIFYKDVNSLAYYNITPGTVISLQIKERGGRKK